MVYLYHLCVGGRMRLLKAEVQSGRLRPAAYRQRLERAVQRDAAIATSLRQAWR